MTTQVSKQNEKRFQGKHMLLLMLAFFGVIIAVNMTMAMLASRSWTGLVVKNSYVASQQYNEKLEAAKTIHASGMYSEIAYENGMLVFALKDKDGTSLSASNLKVKIGRPAFEQQDRILNFLPAPNQSYKLPLNLDQGDWFIEVTGEVEATVYRRDARLFVDANDKGMLR